MKIKKSLSSDIKKWLWLWLLPKLNDCRCGGLIPRSGEKARKVNCFSIYLNNKNNQSIMLVDSIDQYRFIGRCLDENQSFNIFEGYPVEKAIQLNLEIWHYYGIHEFVYGNIFEYLLKSYSGLDRVLAKTHNIYRSIAQWIFNRKTLEAGERYDLLKFLVCRFNKGNFSIVDVMFNKYGTNVFRRPDYNSLANEISALISFLVDTNELKVNNRGQYSVTGEGWKTVNDYEETDRRVSAANKIQYGLFALSFAVALLTAGQAGLIKFPTLLDLRSEDEIKAQESKETITQINKYCSAQPPKKRLN